MSVLFDLSVGNRQRRLDELIWEAFAIYKQAVAEYITDYVDGHGAGRRHTATFLLFSGGNDSTVLAHLFRHVATHAVHANTGIGIEQTRQFVRDTSRAWDLPLIEKSPPPGSTYRELVLADGFPGPAKHWKMYHRLKERALAAAWMSVCSDPRRERVVFLAGRRLTESDRREQRNIPYSEIKRSIKSAVWVSPLRDWTALDMNTYRMRYPDCPRNPVADLLHMSGECLCGSFAKVDELDEIGTWFPEVRDEIEALQDEARLAGVPEERCKWGWGAGRERPSRVGPMCSSCAQDALFDMPGVAA